MTSLLKYVLHTGVDELDLGLEGTFLNEVLYKKATFLNLVDPISHDLLMSLARDLQCPKKEYDPWKSSDRICRQLIYHLTPHSKWHRSGLPRCKSRRSLKSNLQKQLSQDAINLSGIALSTRDIQHLACYLQNSGDHLLTIDLSFTDLNDDKMRFLVPFLWSLPSLTHLSLNGNHLTRATVKELTDTMKDTAKFPSLAWVDLGNNVDVSSMPQPLLVGLRKRLSQQTTLPTIYESLDCDSQASRKGAPSEMQNEATCCSCCGKAYGASPGSFPSQLRWVRRSEEPRESGVEGLNGCCLGAWMDSACPLLLPLFLSEQRGMEREAGQRLQPKHVTRCHCQGI
ncbi:leucine-rich repeat-containing protein 75B [Python bivittatus]|uniref:Leucine-rich repeat-containing protein 75B n=1 Tax=Python bivittatus TaxID=176946 RepID=A0A9F5N4H9_PYTBI|nr:leucine-rich repeat-containing protein 75B [Python bivittatus]